MDLGDVSEVFGFAGFFLWAVLERAFTLSGQQQSRGARRNQGSYWLINAAWYGAVLYASLDALRFRLTVFGTPWWGLRGAGMLFTASGIVIRYLARKALGKNYSVHVETSATHDLITEGIYTIIRHPAYLGLMCLFLGIPLCLGSWGGVVIAGAVGLPAVLYRIGIEESFLSLQFPEQYQAYQEKTWRVLPYLW